MNFSSIAFLFFFLFITVIIYKCLPQRIRNLFLVAASLVFCFTASPISALIAVISTVINFLMGFFIARSVKKSRRKAILIFSITLNLLVLALFKYSGLIADTLGFTLPFNLIFPIGISYYTFSAISYSVDVYKGENPQNIINFATYMLMFPKFVQGPIAKYKEVAPQLKSRKSTSVLTAEGIRRFVCGLAKKVLVANQLSNLHSELSRNLTEFGTLSAWVSIIAYALYIYFDFSSYTDMAIGIGKMLGFELPENFNYPYTATSITDFWRRWHITLSRWFRDYLYIPLGGNRRGKLRTVFNLFVVWAATGIWHGASWNFLLWGIYYFLLLVVEKFVFRSKLEKIPVFNRIYTLFFVGMSWVLFFCTDLSQISTYFSALFTGNGFLSADAGYVIISYLPTLLIAAFGSFSFPRRLYGRIFENPRMAWADCVINVAVLILCIAAIVSGSYTPFLYAAF